MKKLTNEYRFDIRLRWKPWVKARLAMLASYTRQIVNLKNRTDDVEKNKIDNNLPSGSVSPKAVQQDTDLGA